MVQLKIAFLDDEAAYLEQLRAYVVRKKELFFQISTFTSAEVFFERLSETEFDAVVMTERFFERLKGMEFGARKILLCEKTRSAAVAELPFVVKHQPAEKLLCGISAMFWREESGRQGELPGKTSEMIGIYSPAYHESQALFAATMAQILGESQKVLYVNLTDDAGFCEMECAEESEDLGDLIYGMQQREHDFAAGLHRVRKTCRNFDYILPVANPEHLPEITKPLWEQLFLALKNRSNYDVVILDIGIIFPGFAEMIPLFGSFYCLGKEGAANRRRTEAFFTYLGKAGAHIAAHVNRLLLSEQTALSGEGNFLESGLYGGMGDFIRGCLYGGSEFG